MKIIEDIIRELNLKCTALKTNSVTIEQTDGNDEFKCNSHVSDFNKGKIEGLSEAKKLLEEVKQLDEPQKPVVPKFVADWFEENKDDLDNAIFGYLVFWEERDTDSALYQWFAKSENKPIETLIRMKDGYEVEKEPLYYVYLPKIIASPEMFFPDIEGAYLMKSDDEIELADNNDFDDMKFTEQEIKAIDERYWPFAVPVEEVAEG
ncbi:MULTISPECIES: DUF1642 domain-containing protein [unclassified Enterococcus]|uniref:DUF1642 domain-containing protein n=1 Tax=unclassified Enterococcus TaxID=2608891 RepID=UPI0013ED3174|nr:MULTISPECIES: DUF1642 domain-containing protein [unclassified Enterococcus]